MILQYIRIISNREPTKYELFVDFFHQSPHIKIAREGTWANHSNRLEGKNKNKLSLIWSDPVRVMAFSGSEV